MLKFIARVIIITITVLLVGMFVPGIIVTGSMAAILFVLVLGLVNALLRPLVMLITWPLRWLTLGLFTLVINTLMFWLASIVVSGIVIDSFFSAFLGALIVGVVSWVVNHLLKENKKD